MPIAKESSSGIHRVKQRRKLLRVEETRHSDQLYPRVTVGALPDNVLLEIFDFYVFIYSSQRRGEDAWHTLVHVCKTWRSIVFASPKRLRLQLLCTNKRPVENSLDIWPKFPIVVEGRAGMTSPQDANNIIAAFEQHNRVCKITIRDIPNTFLEKIWAMEMRGPFPALTFLWLWSPDDNALALPDSFLGGSAPRLREIYLEGIPFPGLRKLLLSTCDLVILSLWDIPHSGYVSPEAIVTCLSSLTRLENLDIEFRTPRSRADRENRLLPRQTRVVIPALTKFSFKGDSEYLEDIVAQIDTPRLDRLGIMFFNQLIIDTPLLRHFISRTETVKLPHQAEMTFGWDRVSFDLARQDGNGKWGPSILSSSILCRPSDWQLSSLAQICDSVLFPHPTVDRLEIGGGGKYWQDDMDNTQWLEVLGPFTSVKDLVLRGNLIQLVALALEDLTEERVTEVLPALQNLFLQGPQPSESVNKVLGKFIAARQLSGHPVTVHHRETWDQIIDAGRSVIDKYTLLSIRSAFVLSIYDLLFPPTR